VLPSSNDVIGSAPIKINARLQMSIGELAVVLTVAIVAREGFCPLSP
jgi:hypothetical protein